VSKRLALVGYRGAGEPKVQVVVQLNKTKREREMARFWSIICVLWVTKHQLGVSIVSIFSEGPPVRSEGLSSGGCVAGKNVCVKQRSFNVSFLYDDGGGSMYRKKTPEVQIWGCGNLALLNENNICVSERRDTRPNDEEYINGGYCEYEARGRDKNGVVDVKDGASSCGGHKKEKRDADLETAG